MNARHFNHEKLKALRLKKGETQEQVAKALGVHRQTVYRAESGQDIPYELLCDLATHYEVEVVTLLYREPKAA